MYHYIFVHNNIGSINIFFISRIFGGSVKYCYLCVAFRCLDLELNQGRQHLMEFLLFNADSHALLLYCIAQTLNLPKRVVSIVDDFYLVLWFKSHSNRELSPSR